MYGNIRVCNRSGKLNHYACPNLKQQLLLVKIHNLKLNKAFLRRNIFIISPTQLFQQI